MVRYFLSYARIKTVFLSMDGHRVQTIEDVTTTADVFITCTGNRNVITRQHMNKMKNGAVVANMGHRFGLKLSFYCKLTLFK